MATPEQVHEISEILVQQSLLIFVVHPFLIFVGCLFVNNVAFCDGVNRFRSLHGLWYMLLVLVPGYLSWSWWLVCWWGETATVVLGWDEGRREGDFSTLQAVLLWVALPFVGVVAGLYDGLVYLAEACMNRRARGGGSQRLPRKPSTRSVHHDEKEKKDL